MYSNYWSTKLESLNLRMKANHSILNYGMKLGNMNLVDEKNLSDFEAVVNGLAENTFSNKPDRVL
jgi:hypothetical protein